MKTKISIGEKLFIVIAILTALFIFVIKFYRWVNGM